MSPVVKLKFLRYDLLCSDGRGRSYGEEGQTSIYLLPRHSELLCSFFFFFLFGKNAMGSDVYL